MKLRTRLALVLLLLSVVPLGAVTVYAYLNNKATLEETAAREADLLASELTARMQLITAELSNRVGQLMAMQARAEVVPVSSQTPKPAASKPAAAKPAETKPADTKSTAAKPADTKTQQTGAAATPASGPNASAPVAPVAMESQVASALGEAAMLLNSVELHGARGYRGRPPGMPGGGGPQPPPGDRPAPPGGFPPRGGGDRNQAGTQAGTQAGGQGGTGSGRRNFPGRSSEGTVLTPPPPTASGTTVPPVTGTATASPNPAVASPVPVAPVAPATPVTANDPNRIVIDMGAISRDLMKKMMPDGTANMTTEERQRLQREMGMRLMGITEGLKLGAVELQKKADAAKLQAQEEAKKAEAAHAAAPDSEDAGPTQTKSALKGNKLDVTLERNGQVVHAVNAEINVEQVLMTIFSTTRRDRGEVPFAVAKDGKLYTSVPSDKSVVGTFGAAIAPGSKAGKTILPDWIVMTTDDTSGSGLRFGIARPVGDSMNELRARAERNAGLGLVLIALALVGVVPLSSRLTRNLSTLTDGVDSIARGDYTARVPVRSNDEMGKLAAAFNQMAADVQEHQRSLVSQERLKRELELGRQIQSEMLPHEPLRIGLMEVRGESVPAREVGGDFFNYFTLPSGEVALLLGDVSGKGVGAALVMANIQATLRTRLALEQDLTVITDAIDRELETSTRAAYATLIVGIYNPVSKRIRFVNAGHNPQFVLRANGGLEQMTSTGTPVGLLSGRGYQQGALQLASGDFIFFYTDGMVEAENDLGEFFGSERLEAVLLDSHKRSHGSIDIIFRDVKSAIKEFSGTREPFDDATMMAVRIG